MDNENLKIIIFVVLQVGNALNEGDEARGGASGFKPTTLTKAAELRTSTKPVRTLLQYICDLIWDQKPAALTVAANLSTCDKASRVDIAYLEGKSAALKAGLNKVKATVDKAKKTNDATGVLGDADPLATVLAEFVEEAEPKIADLVDFIKEAQTTFDSAAAFIGYSAKDLKKGVKPEEMFKIVSSFAKNIEAIRKAKQEKADKEAKREAMAKDRAAKDAARKAKGSKR
eukprot:GHVT01032924.1.p1 GENE.GHVT01032924.1~~GHVT01032924.1.p1  ORF type:complete len:229 (+),score=45.89 GHVT01032924.1:1700-2386(+)